MNADVLLISRLALVVVWIAACFVARRAIVAAFTRRNHGAAGRMAFVLIIVVSLLIAAAFMARPALLVAAKSSARHSRWHSVDVSYRYYARSGGTLTPAMRTDWADALMRERRYSDAESVLAGETSAAAMLMIGECLYFRGRNAEAESLLERLPKTSRDYVRTYILGRITERRDHVQDARRLYDASFYAHPAFFPAFYCGARLDLIEGASRKAQFKTMVYRKANGSAVLDPLFYAISAAANGEGPIPQPVEFLIGAE